MFWGLTPCLDLLELYSPQNVPGEINILLTGNADARHILQTTAKRYRHEARKTKINFYIIEASIETIAKQLLLINTAMQDKSVMGLTAKVKTFMEIYGNSLLRPEAAKFLRSTSTELVKMITDFEYLKSKMPFVEMDIKYKERDCLENLLKFWCGTDAFDICDSWDRRLRKNLGVRYDSKIGAFDWDLHMRLHNVGAKQICNQEYRSFRLNGVAFNWLESEVSKPNRSLVCVVAPNGEGFYHYGYLGDMQTGPFVSYGLKCEENEFLKNTNGQNMYRATDVSERNLRQIFHELQFEEEYEHRTTSDLKLGQMVINFGEKKIIDIKESKSSFHTSTNNKCFNLENVKIKFISLNMLSRMLHKSEFQGFFDILYFGCFYVKHITKELVDHVLKTNGLVVVENQKFVVSHREKQLKEFGDEIKKALDGSKTTPLDFDPCKDDFAIFIKT